MLVKIKQIYETNLNKKPTALNDKDKFLLGLARALLTESEIFMIYEFPIGLTSSEQEMIKQVLVNLKNIFLVLLCILQTMVLDLKIDYKHK